MMLNYVCKYVCRTAQTVAPSAHLKAALKRNRACSSSDRSYPSEPRVGVGVVILRPNAHNKASAEVHRLFSRQMQVFCSMTKTYFCCRSC